MPRFVSACLAGWLVVSISACSAGSTPGTAPVTTVVPDAGPVRPPTPLVNNPPASRETCGNGLDDESNGMADDGCPCMPGQTQACYVGAPARAGVGICARGTQTCMASGEFGLWSACTGSVAPTAEVCGDGLDNDCTGAVDDGACAPTPMPTPMPTPNPPTPGPTPTPGPPAPMPPASCSAPIDLTPTFPGDVKTVTSTTCGAIDIARLYCSSGTGAPDAFFTWYAPNERYSVVWEVTPGFEVGLAQDYNPCEFAEYACEREDASDYAHPHTLMVEKVDGGCGDFTLTVRWLP